MARDCLRAVRIQQPVPACHIRRVGSDHIKRSSRKNFACFPDIACDNVDFIIQMIERDASSRKVRALLLNFKRAEVCGLRLRAQKKRYDAGTCAQVQNLRPLRCFREARKQHRVHAKTKPLRILINPEVRTLQIIQLDAH